MKEILNKLEIPSNKPLYLYQQPMFMLTVSVVLIDENGVILVKDKDRLKFPGGVVRAGQETVQFSAVRQVKEQVGIVLKKEALIPVDYRSSPERSEEGNVVDIGMVCILGDKEQPWNENSKWFEVDFESRKIIDEKQPLYMDHKLLLNRSIDVALMMR